MKRVLAEIKIKYTDKLVVITGSIFMIGKAQELVI
jgi:hypothetical protein